MPVQPISPSILRFRPAETCIIRRGRRRRGRFLNYFPITRGKRIPLAVELRYRLNSPLEVFAVAGHLRVRFGSFEANLGTGDLFKDSVQLRLQEKPFQILALLLKTPGELVTREEICSKLWPDVFVQKDFCLNTAIRRLRAVLETGAPSASLIETVGRRGYRLCAEVTPTPANLPATSTPANSPGPRLVAIPFDNLNGQARYYFADDLTEQMSMQLARMYKDLNGLRSLLETFAPYS